jgi:hypothetical protein
VALGSRPTAPTGGRRPPVAQTPARSRALRQQTPSPVPQLPTRSAPLAATTLSTEPEARTSSGEEEVTTPSKARVATTG